MQQPSVADVSVVARLRDVLADINKNNADVHRATTKVDDAEKAFKAAPTDKMLEKFYNDAVDERKQLRTKELALLTERAALEAKLPAGRSPPASCCGPLAVRCLGGVAQRRVEAPRMTID